MNGTRCVDSDKIVLPRQLYKCLPVEFSVNTAYIAIYMPVHMYTLYKDGGSRTVYRLRLCANKSSIGQSMAVLDISLRHSVSVDCQQQTFYLWWHAVWSNAHHFEQGGGSFAAFVYMHMTLMWQLFQLWAELPQHRADNFWNNDSLISGTHPPSFLSVTKLIYFFHRKLKHQKYC